MKVAKNTEIEIRGKLGKKVFRKTFSQLKKSGRLINHYKRLSVDLSPGFDSKSRSWKSDDQIDLRVKKSGNSEKISLKIGKIHAKKRQEIEIRLKKGEFLNSVSLLENLGFNKGMIYFWESWEFEYKTLLTWKKPMGLGFWFRGCTEHLVVALRGKVKPFRIQKENFFQTKHRLKHSEKPEEIRKLIDEAAFNSFGSRSNKLELFARKQVLDWTCWGWEVDSQTVQQKITATG